MAKYLIRASYTPDGVRGMVKEGAQARRAAIQKLVESVGGTVEAFYFAYGDVDAYVITDIPDASAGLAISLAANASGAVRVSTVPLITTEEMDAATKRSVPYRPPGSAQ